MLAAAPSQASVLGGFGDLERGPKVKVLDLFLQNVGPLGTWVWEEGQSLPVTGWTFS